LQLLKGEIAFERAKTSALPHVDAIATDRKFVP